jgi:methionyl aminopeptidase
VLFDRRRVVLKSRSQVEKMAVAGRLTAAALDAVAEVIRPGMTPLQLNAIADAVIRDGGGTPNFIGVLGHLAPFEHATCISIDDEVVHGIPDDRVIEEGMMVSVDCGAEVDGWNGDSARTFLIGDVPEEKRKLSEVTRAGMLAGVRASIPGNTLEDVAAAIEDVGLAAGYGIVRGYVGHGIGNEMHEEPQVTNYRTGRRGRKIEVGLCIAIEPMFTAGSFETRVKADGWTVATVDGSLAAHWEHSIAVTAEGPRILTLAAGEVFEGLPATAGADV